VLAAVARSCSGLRQLVSPKGELAGHYLLSVEGQRFLSDLNESIPPGMHLLLLSSDAGG
jgi:hypothetical protein